MTCLPFSWQRLDSNNLNINSPLVGSPSSQQDLISLQLAALLKIKMSLVSCLIICLITTTFCLALSDRSVVEVDDPLEPLKKKTSGSALGEEQTLRFLRGIDKNYVDDELGPVSYLIELANIRTENCLKERLVNITELIKNALHMPIRQYLEQVSSEQRNLCARTFEKRFLMEYAKLDQKDAEAVERFSRHMPERGIDDWYDLKEFVAGLKSYLEAEEPAARLKVSAGCGDEAEVRLRKRLSEACRRFNEHFDDFLYIIKRPFRAEIEVNEETNRLVSGAKACYHFHFKKFARAIENLLSMFHLQQAVVEDVAAQLRWLDGDHWYRNLNKIPQKHVFRALIHYASEREFVSTHLHTRSKLNKSFFRRFQKLKQICDSLSKFFGDHIWLIDHQFISLMNSQQLLQLQTLKVCFLIPQTEEDLYKLTQQVEDWSAKRNMFGLITRITHKRRT